MPVLDATGPITFDGAAHEHAVLSPGTGEGYEDQQIQFGGSASIIIDAPVATPPGPHHLIGTKWLTIAAGPTLDANGQPDPTAWRASAVEHSGVWGRYRIVVAGKDVSFF